MYWTVIFVRKPLLAAALCWGCVGPGWNHLLGAVQRSLAAQVAELLVRVHSASVRLQVASVSADGARSDAAVTEICEGSRLSVPAGTPQKRCRSAVADPG